MAKLETWCDNINGDAVVVERAKVCGDAIVCENDTMCGDINAEDAWVSENAWVSGDAKVISCADDNDDTKRETNKLDENAFMTYFRKMVAFFYR